MSGIINQFLPLINELIAQGKSNKDIVTEVLKQFPGVNASTVSTQTYKARKPGAKNVKTVRTGEHEVSLKVKSGGVEDVEIEAKRVIIEQILKLRPEKFYPIENYYNFSIAQLEKHLCMVQKKLAKVEPITEEEIVEEVKKDE